MYTMANLTFIAPTLSLSTSIAIVGSSGNLRNKKFGSVINQYDDVVRFNRAPVKGYEEMVGAKTTLRGANNHVFINLAPSLKGFTCQPPNFIKDLRNSRILYMGPGMSQENKDRHTHSSNSLFVFKFKSLGDLKCAAGFTSPSDPSLGCIVICLCVIAGLKPALFGFDLDVKDASRTHYWEERPSPGPCHKVNYEKDFFNKLLGQDKIKVFK